MIEMTIKDLKKQYELYKERMEKAKCSYAIISYEEFKSALERLR